MCFPCFVGSLKLKFLAGLDTGYNASENETNCELNLLSVIGSLSSSHRAKPFFDEPPSCTEV
uniref:Uncharacterized protein n=1 Tax=Megaselia scalaris TaxID=36166 RepID=T1GRZ4_MEGSC